MSGNERQDKPAQEPAVSGAREAGRSVAPGKVTRTSKLPLGAAPGLQRKAVAPAAGSAPVQRKTAWEFTMDPWMDAAHRGAIAQAKADERPGAADASPRAATGGGKPLPAPVQAKMEQSFGADFSGVRVHEGPQASAVGARAYTQANDVHFAPGAYQPDSRTGQELLGHELAHVVQQRQGRVQASTQYKGVAINDDPALEREADQMGAQAARGETVAGAGVTGSAGAGAVQRQAEPAGTAVVQRSAEPRDDFPWTGVVGAAGQSAGDVALETDTETVVMPEGTRVEVLGSDGIRLRVRYSAPDGTEHIGLVDADKIDDPVSREIDQNMLGENMTWTPSSPGQVDVGGRTVSLGSNSFVQWALAASEGAAPAVQQVTTINCWEMIVLAAYRAGLLPWARIHDIYSQRVPPATVAKLTSLDPAVRAEGQREAEGFVDGLVVDLLTDGSLTAYDVGTKSPQPARGDVVFFNRAAHVTLATGNGDQIYSFWPPPNTAFTSGGTVDAVKITTIEALYNWMDANRARLGMGPMDVLAVEVGAPAW